MHPRRMTVRVVLMSILAFVGAGNAVPAQQLGISPDALHFGRVRFGGDECEFLEIINTSGRAATLVDVRSPASPFPISHIETLEAGDTTELEICFQARRLGPLSSHLTIVYDAGGVDSVVLPMTALGWDSLAVGIGTTIRGKPGNIAHIPVRVFGSIPEVFNIRHYEVSLMYNKSMLYPLDYGFGGQPSLTGGMFPSVQVQRKFGGQQASVKYRIMGEQPLLNPARDSVLLYAPFLVLHGNALSTDLTLTSIWWENGMPSGGVFLKGKFVTDSLCYQDQRLLQPPPLLSVPEVETSPNPMRSASLVRYTLPAAADVRLSVHTMLGEEVTLLDEGPRVKGTHVRRFDASGLPAGMYICRLVAGHAAASSTILLLR
ncbi:MAG: hypothetical protein C0600_09335 [Ignavibacteria bacterium]|nr:MAG: hypothetical protein C0600_09335 [Ignavibacteria bacterium]